MSKRAEELARKIDCMTNRVDINLDIPKAAEMIDAELRKERERCAERADLWLDSEVKSSGLEDNPAFARLRQQQHLKLRAAILEAD